MTKKIYLDPGHGGSDPGASGNGLKEKDVVLKIAKYTRDYLNDNYTGHSIRMSRTSDKTVSLTSRTNDANRWGADVFVSIHINAGGGKGYEDFIYNGSVSQNTRNLQNAVHKEVSKLFKTNRGKKRANFHVLRESRMSAVLTECGFIDNKGDAEFLSKDSNLKKLGEAHAKGIADFLNLKKKSGSKSTSSQKTTSKKKSSPKKANKPKANLKVDGYWGKQTTRALQRYFGTPVDGEIWGQYKGNQAAKAITGGIKYGPPYGSPVIKALQKHVGAKVDGVLGPQTVRVLQRHLKTPVDGEIWKPSTMVKAMQKRLNGGDL